MNNHKIVKLPKIDSRDPRNIKSDFYEEVADLLRDIRAGDSGGEARMTIRERIAAMALVGRMLGVLGIGKQEEDDNAIAGSAVRKYATAFTAHDPRKRKKTPRPFSTDPDRIVDTVISDLVDGHSKTVFTPTPDDDD